MNRFAPPMTRQFGTRLPELLLTADLIEKPAGTLIEDLKLFAVGWLGGLVFFGTFLA